MADNVTLDAGSGGDTIAADDVGGVKIPRSKIVIGADGTNDGDVSSANPMPVTHAALTELAAAIDTEVQVDVVSSALPSGAATSAKQDTIIGHVDGIETVLGTIDTDTGNIATSVATVAGAVSGTEMQVDVLTMPTVTVDLGVNNDVTVTGSVTANAGTNLDTSLLALESGGNLAACATSLGTIDNAISGNEMQVDIVSSALPSGAATLAEQQTQTASLSVLDDWDESDACKVRLDPRTSGGLSVFKTTDLDETEEDVKTSAGQLYGIYAFNTSSSKRYIKVYNATAANVTVGSTATVLDLPIPVSDSGFFLSFPHGIAFSTAISVAATTGLGDADTGAPGASEVICHVTYK